MAFCFYLLCASCFRAAPGTHGGRKISNSHLYQRRGDREAAFYILQGGDSVSRTLLSAQKHAEKRRKRDADMGAKWPGKNDDKNQIIDWQGGER